MTDSKSAYSYGKFILASGVVIFAIGQSLLFIIVAPMARSIGLTELQFGVAFSLANISLIFAGPFWGKKSDKIGRKPVFVIGLIGSAVGTLAMAATLGLGLRGTLAGGGIIGMIFLSRFLYGLTAGCETWSGVRKNDLWLNMNKGSTEMIFSMFTCTGSPLAHIDFMSVSSLG